MEPATSLVTALAAKSGEAAVEVAKEEAKGFLQKLFGPSAEAIGEDFALRHRERLFNNTVEVLSRAKRRLKAKGITPQEVPLKIIHPLLEAASLEEEPDLQEMYGNLLASAAEGQQPFAASFVDILRQLTPEEARFLKVLHARLQKDIETYDARPEGSQHWHPMTRLGMFDELKVLMFEAAQMQVTEENRVNAEILVMSAFENLSRLGLLRSPTMGQPNYSMTSFGMVFFDRCGGYKAEGS